MIAIILRFLPHIGIGFVFQQDLENIVHIFKACLLCKPFYSSCDWVRHFYDSEIVSVRRYYVCSEIIINSKILNLLLLKLEQ